MTARPTLRCLAEDLHLDLPPARFPLDELDHPLVSKAGEQFADGKARHERIVSIDDAVLFKVKIARWRGAVWSETPGTIPQHWIIAAGTREDGSNGDFYAAFRSTTEQARRRYNADHDQPLRTQTYCGTLLPCELDHKRYALEAATRFARSLNRTLRDLLRRSILDGREHEADLSGFHLGVVVRADEGHETYVAIRITGSVPEDLTGVILKQVPGCDVEAWFPEVALPQRELSPAEQVWSNLMDPEAAASLLGYER